MELSLYLKIVIMIFFFEVNFSSFLSQYVIFFSLYAFSSVKSLIEKGHLISIMEFSLISPSGDAAKYGSSGSKNNPADFAL